jgi:diaminohydroxyphosphoribosylaminopyrimidine deaminase/5-amino-6-(5-phosphoribosylamino)uracil reductase
MTRHEALLQRALDLALSGAGTTSPNPMVGAIVARRGEVIAEGYHARAGEEHAEEIALRLAGEAARGSDLLVTLEPCAHQGRRPPCVEAIVRAGVRRVFACIQDPNPLVDGRGFARLRQAGIEVHHGFWEKEARRLNEAYLKWIVGGRPFVCLKVAASLDGRIAGPPGSPRWITGEAARAEVQRLRFEADAILIGSGTALADDPSLSVREPAPRKPIVKVVLDSRLRLPPVARLLGRGEGDRVLVYAARGAEPARARALSEAGAEVMEVAGEAGRLDLAAVLDDLGRREIVHLLCEGGAQVLSSFLGQRLADKLHLFIGAKILGGGALSWCGELGGVGGGAPLRLRDPRPRVLDGDIWIEAYFG